MSSSVTSFPLSYEAGYVKPNHQISMRVHITGGSPVTVLMVGVTPEPTVRGASGLRRSCCRRSLRKWTTVSAKC